jgi:hypothetical protein
MTRLKSFLPYTGISILTSRPADNVHPSPSVCNVLAPLLTAESLRRLRRDLKSKIWRVSHPFLKHSSLFRRAQRRTLSQSAARLQDKHLPRWRRRGARYPRKVNVFVVKLARLGKIPGRFAAGTPNHDASVAPYWSSAVVGIQRPLLATSLGPPSENTGSVP